MCRTKNKSARFKKPVMVLLGWFMYLCSPAQCPTHQVFWDKVLAIESSDDSYEEKIPQLTALKKLYETCGLQKDSVYARILHRLGACEYREALYKEAYQNTTLALKINSSGKAGACKSYTANNYYNIAQCYEDGFTNFSQALKYYDSAIAIGKNIPAFKLYVSFARLRRSHIFYVKGDYEKAIEETTLGLQVSRDIADTTRMIKLLLERSQSYEMRRQLTAALNDIDQSLALLQALKDDEQYDSWADAFRYKADILADEHDCTGALELYKKCIAFRKKTDDVSQIATDYNDAGFLLLDKCNNLSEAKKYFKAAYNIASSANDNNVSALAADNLAQVCFYTKDYMNALRNYQHALQLIVPNAALKDLTANPAYKDLAGLQSKNFLVLYLDNKCKSLLYLYKQTNNTGFLKSCISTALLTDSIITDLRHEQSGEQSKLYWRNETRDFFTRAIEACYLDNNDSSAFFFMEKSRAVLLNDQLNELGAAAHLPAAEALKEESLQMNIITQQQKLSVLQPTSTQYQSQLNKLLEAKEDFENYIRSIEQKYPAYYQYKYKNEVPSLKKLQQYLAVNKQSFVHYFIGDTVTYILAIMPGSTKFIKLVSKDFNSTQLNTFLQMCSDRQALNNSYDKFIALSNAIYASLFRPLHIPKGYVIICADNFLIPFEALSSDTRGKKFLIYDYTFSYAYSANYLLTEFADHKAKGDFLGIAPVSFAAYTGLPELKQSAAALDAAASGYNHVSLLTETKASSKNFLQEVTKYTIVNIFSHASADSSDNEPTLFMADSMIRLSQLQLINNAATKLVVLSACETNVGKNATGEGIYSLARGFASAGIPAVSATLWKADETTIYTITEMFNHNLAAGMNKDEALRQAKLAFIQNSSDDRLLPYYWANMVLVGNTQPVQLSAAKPAWWWISGITVIVILLVVFITKKRKYTPDISPVL